MALAENASTAAAKFAGLPIAKQLGLLIGLAASVAMGMGIILWSRAPNMMPIYGHLSARDTVEVTDVLQRNSLPFELDQSSGNILVPANQVQTVRIKLAAEGLPKGDTGGFDLFAGSNAFNSSQFMENARYKQALENELAKTISQFNDIKSARVHLAIPRESAFVRDNREPSASVFIDVYSGYETKKQTIASIVNLVASSIPSLNASRVTVVDQDGQLLSEGGGQSIFSTTERYSDYRQSMEKQYADKIQEILTPILGYGRVRAKVSADLDFTSYEQTQETFDPKDPSLRSEQKMEEKKQVGGSGGGVAGSLSNRPPQSPVQQAPTGPPRKNSAANNQQQPDPNAEASDYRLQSTKNFELDKTISHTRKQPGTIRRLTVAVLVDNHEVMDEKTKKMVNKPLTPAEIDQIKLLVGDAIGLDAKRGDSLNVVNSNFVKPAPIAPIPKASFWQTDMFWSLVKQGVGGLLVLIILLGVLRPVFKSLVGLPKPHEEDEAVDGDLTYQNHSNLPTLGNDYESQLALLRQIVDKEPKRVAQVVKTWVDRG